MPTNSLSARAVSGPRHRAPAYDRLGDFLTAFWAVLHIPVFMLLGIVVHQDHALPRAVTTATTPDLPTV
ncbi:hypothetical protein LN042_32970 [Kitasatospora sp. RB6PN24]|uniref:hypothetical protein n=1 Tax=Kitasatospora humi TaxID=2893891 RepID=UPI001E3CD0E8|nr:hypothetical protein [Kitasatospora humi]MCC9311822.1 hypothetical protein [Kitasatospora humi]